MRRVVLPKTTEASKILPRLVSQIEAVPPHLLEREVQRELLSQPRLRFSTLVVRRMSHGVCLQGVVEVDGDDIDVTSIAQRVVGVEKVINQLVVAPREHAASL